MKIPFLVVSVMFVLCISTLSSQTTAQQAAKPQADLSEREMLNEILLEVKQLRAIINKTNVNLVRFQVAYDQVKSQQNRVDSINRELELLRNQISASPSQYRTTTEEQLKSAEEQLLQETDTNRRRTLEQRINLFKRSLENQDRQDKRWKDREITLTTQLQTEILKLNELNSQLESIKQDINSMINK